MHLMNPHPSAEPRVTFLGAAQTVTGSLHIVEANGRRLLLDCGLFQGNRAEARQRNSHFPFDPRSIDLVVLSHAHLDHCGNLPTLVRGGFTGPIYCTPATRDLAAVMLADSAKIQEEDADFLNRHREPGEPAVEPLYGREDARRAVGQIQSVAYHRDADLGHGFRLRLVDAGHLLGSAMVSLTIAGNGREYSLTFTGDVGRPGVPILRDPEPVPPGDVLLCESTYGGETHPAVAELAGELGEVVRRTAGRGGKVLIPAFSLGRTQTVIYYLHQLVSAGQLPELPVFVDSPLASDATEVFRLHPECFDEETARLLEDDPDLFGGRRVRYVRTVDESKALNGRREPCIIIASSGMCEAGRILHHLAHNVEDPRTTVVLVGFQAPNTLGRRLADHQPEVRILNRTYRPRAEVVTLSGFSSHADQNDLLRYLRPLVGRVKRVRLVHGEPERAEALAQALRSAGFPDTAVPRPGDSVSLA
jgi:metallo-beta-lactamase family protein